jgi:hypothetical protein
MKAIGYLIAACVVCAALQAAATVLVLAIVLAAVCGLIARPRETVGLLALVFAAGLIDRHPLVLLVAAAALFLTAFLTAKAG